MNGYSDAGPAPPPPPPPPPVPGQVPALRISTASEASPRRPLQGGPQDPYEPPAAIQNAMMTKDKKPFTYTPGMGGKLDLSQIRSPRMARRVAKNAEDEGIEGPPKATSPLTSPQGVPQPSIYSHPQVAVPVFPQNIPQQSANNLRNTVPRPAPVVVERQEPPPRPTVKLMSQPSNNGDNQSPTPPTSPTQVTLAKAPTPWMQKSTKQPEELPAWAKKANNRTEVQFDEDVNAMMYPPPPQVQGARITPTVQQQYIPQHQMRQIPQETKFVVPRIEDRPSVFAAMNDGNSHHQLSNSTPHHQSRWGNPVGQSAAPVQQTQGGAYIIPVQIEGQNTVSSPSNGNHHPPQFNRSNSRGYAPVSPSQAEPGPVQSKSFRVLQKITDTDADQLDGEQLRKLQLTEDDRYLMNKFKEQVDAENYLHQVEDPRYRGAAIPSRAFRYLQNMTDSSDVPVVNNTPKPNSAAKKQNTTTFVEVPVVQHIPASQQQVPEPKKYTGGAIPSRSFRILQAMTSPESVGYRWGCNDSPITSSNHNAITTEEPTYTSYSPTYFMNSESTQDNKQKFNEEEKVSYGRNSKEEEEEQNGFWTINDDEKKELGRSENNNGWLGQIDETEKEEEKEDEQDDDDDDKDEKEKSDKELEAEEEETETEEEEEEETEDDDEGEVKIDNKVKQEEKVHKEQEEEYEDEEEKDEDEDEDDDDENEEVEAEEEQENADSDEEESSVFGSDSDSYLGFTIKRDFMNKIQGDQTKEEKNVEQNDSTDCDEDEILEDDKNTHENNVDKSCDESLNNQTVDVKIPLKLKFSVSEESEDVTTVTISESSVSDDVETHFTLKKPKSNDSVPQESNEPSQPTLVVSNGDNTKVLETVKIQESFSDFKLEHTSKTLLNVKNHSKEEVTDDEDSGVTSDISRVSDTEFCLTQTMTVLETTIPEDQPMTKRSQKKYDRTQTHSRLFRLLSDEHKKPSSIPTLTTPDTSQLPGRPKSLDREGLFRQQQDDSYYKTWKNSDNIAADPHLTRPRLGVYCPRTQSGKNLSQIPRLRQLQQQTFSSGIPTPLRTSRRC